jgi:hypothetical protein
MSDLEGDGAVNTGKGKRELLTITRSISTQLSTFSKDNPKVPTEVDEETENWPISDDMQKYLCKIKRMHYVQPLRAYVEGNFIKPNDVNGVLSNVLVEAHFSLKHYRIQREGEKGFDSFTANIEQINVLKRGAPKAPNPYKRHNPRIGPLEVKRTKLTTQASEASTSTQRGNYYIDINP